MSFRVLVSAPYFLPVVEEYRPRLANEGIELVVASVKERLSESELLPLVPGIDGALCGDDQYTERVLRAAPRLKVISKWGTGIDSIDQNAARRLGVRVCNTPNAFTEAVADTALGYMLCFARNLPWMDRDLRAGKWHKYPAVSLRECVLGVIGVGHIGKAVVRRAVAFGMKVLGNDIAPLPEPFVTSTGLEATSLENLLQRSDFVTLHCTLNPTSHHLLSHREFGLMKPTAVVVNTARGPVIDESALVEALCANRLGGAALDVFEQEPLPDGSPLRALDNCLLAPHNSNSSPEAWRRVHENTVRNLLEGLRPGSGGPR